jgi:hypothetical protein
MKITKNQLRQIIKEELASVVADSYDPYESTYSHYQEPVTPKAIAAAEAEGYIDSDQDTQDNWQWISYRDAQVRKYLADVKHGRIEEDGFSGNGPLGEPIEEAGESLLDRVRGMIKRPSAKSTADDTDFTAAAFLRSLDIDPGTEKEADKAQHDPDYAQRFANKLEEDEVEESFGGSLPGTEPLSKSMSGTSKMKGTGAMPGTGKLPGSGAGGDGKGRPEHPEAARLRRLRGR